MPYRRVSYAEQCWYILRFKMREVLRMPRWPDHAEYLGVPSCAYQVDYFTISKDGCVSFDDRADSEEIESLIEALAAQGFTAEAPTDGGEETGKVAQDTPDAGAAAEADSEEETGLTISVPMDGFNPDSLDRLQKLIDSKAALIKKALGADRLTVRTRDGKVEFPWWDTLPEPEEVQAYTAFIAALCRMAKEAKRVTATEKDVESEKYAFRGFLLRLGFIGAESKAHRRILLKNLSGASAFPTKAAADAFAAAQKAKRDSAKAAASTEEVTA